MIIRHMLLAALAPLLLQLKPASVESWQTAGDPAYVGRDGSRVTLLAKEPATAGVLSPAKAAPPGTNAVLVSADVTNADSGAVTLSVHDAAGDSIGYWQNPLPITSGKLDAAVPIGKATAPVRLFVGTHRAPSAASLDAIKWEPVRRTMSFSGTMYGAVVHGSNVEAQSFKARGKLAAIRLLIRRMKENDGPDLRVRVYMLGAGATSYTSAEPVAESLIARDRIPQVDQSRQDITIAVPAKLVAGRTYVVEMSTSEPCAPDNGFLIWGGPGTYPDGTRFQNGSAVAGWDLHMEIYESF